MVFVSIFVALVVTLISLLIIEGAFGYWISQFGFEGGIGEPWENILDGEVWQLPIPFSFPLTITVTCHARPPIYIPEAPPLTLHYQLYFYTLKIWGFRWGLSDISALNSIVLQSVLFNFLIFLQLLGLVAGIIITSFYEGFLKR